MIPEFLDSYNCSYLNTLRDDRENKNSWALVQLSERVNLLKRCMEISEDADTFHPRQVEMARAILDGVSNLELHEDLKNRLSPYLNQSGND